MEAALGEPEVAVQVGPDLARAFPAAEVGDGAGRRPRQHVERSREADLVKRPEDGEPKDEAGAEDRLPARALGRAEGLAPREDGAHGARVEERHARGVRGVDQEVAQVPEREGERPARARSMRAAGRAGSRAARPRSEWVSVRWPTRRSSQPASGRQHRPISDVGVSMSGRSAPRRTQAATAGREGDAEDGPGRDREARARRSRGSARASGVSAPGP